MDHLRGDGHRNCRSRLVPAILCTSAAVRSRGDDRESSRAHPDRRSRPPLHLRHPQHRRGSAEGRGDRHARPLPEHRRSDRVRVQDAAAPHRRGRARHARRPQQLRTVGRHRAGARSRRRGVHEKRISDRRRSRVHHRRHVGRDRADAGRRRRRRRRSARADADLSALHGGARQARRQGEVLPARCGARLDAGSRAPREPGDAGDARARDHRSQQPDRRRLLRRRPAARCSTSPIGTGC